MKGNQDLKITVIIGLILLLFLLLAPSQWIFGGRIWCPTRLIFHFHCPLCGMTRATWLLMHGNINAAYRMNGGIFPLAILYLWMCLSIPSKWFRLQLRKITWITLLLIVLIYLAGLIA